MNQPQTIDQFRDFCKVLKLKIMKQKMIIEELQGKNNKLTSQITALKRSSPSPQQKAQQSSATPGNPIKDINSTPYNYPSRPEISAGNLKGKNEIMKVLKAGAEKVGITPQSIFRIADVHSKHQVQSDHFRKALSKMNLGLNPKQISTLIYMFDENCNSYITQEQFIQALQGYQIAEEDLENSTIYKHICLQKLATMMNDGQINAGNFYNQMNTRKEGLVDMSLFEQQIKKTFEGRIYEKEIAGSFYAMDLEGNGYLDRQNFVYGINSSIRKISTMGLSRKIDSVYREPEANSTPGNTGMNTGGIVSGLDGYQSNKKNANNESRMTINNQENRNQQSAINVKIPLQSLTPEEVLGRLKQESGISLSNFYEELCRVPMNKRTTLFNFKKVFHNLAQGRKVEIDIVSSLFKLIDFQQKGSLHFSELLYFYLAQSSDISMALRLLGKYFFNSDLNCERFWFLYGINPDSDISKHRFIEVMGKTFEGPQGADRLWEKLWNYFDKGKGVLPISVLSREMAKYELVENMNS